MRKFLHKKDKFWIYFLSYLNIIFTCGNSMKYVLYHLQVIPNELILLIFLAIHPYHPCVNCLDGTQCQLRAGWLANIGVSMCRSPYTNIFSVFILASPACFAHFIWMVYKMEGKWLYSWCSLGCSLQDLFKQHTASLCCSHQDFSLCITLESKWYIYTVALTWLPLGRIHQRDQFSIYSITCQ